MNLGVALGSLAGSVADLADELRAVGERHAAEQDVFHTGNRLSRRMTDVRSSLSPFLETYGKDTSDGSGSETLRELGERARRARFSVVGRPATSGIMLLRDLRELFVNASGCEIDWAIVRQGAMAARDQSLVDATTVGLEETRRVVTWLKTRIKEAAPQVLMADA
jgi:hypothetical protein